MTQETGGSAFLKIETLRPSSTGIMRASYGDDEGLTIRDYFAAKAMLWHYLKNQSEKHKARFIRCSGVLYEVTKHRYSTGPSPLWSIDEVVAKDVPALPATGEIE